MKYTALALVAALSLSTLVSADELPFVLDFETQDEGWVPSAVLSKEGFTFELTRGSGFEFVNLSGFVAPDGVPATWGQRSLSPFNDFANPEDFRLTLTGMGDKPGTTVPWLGLQLVSGEYGDFLPSDLDVGSFGSEPFVAENTHPTAFFAAGTAGAIQTTQPIAVGDYWTFGGGSPGFDQSLFWDNISFVAVDDLPTSVVAPPLGIGPDPTNGAGGIPGGSTDPVPEPGTLLLVAAGAAAVIWRRRRRA